MRCPGCNGEMSEMSIQGVSLDFCPDCFCAWYDKGELAYQTETSEDVPDLAVAIGSGRVTEKISPRAEGVKLVEVEFVPGSGVMVDVCPQTHGIFLDKGELKKIEALSADRDVFAKIGRTVQELRQQGYSVL